MTFSSHHHPLYELSHGVQFGWPQVSVSVFQTCHVHRLKHNFFKMNGTSPQKMHLRKTGSGIFRSFTLGVPLRCLNSVKSEPHRKIW